MSPKPSLPGQSFFKMIIYAVLVGIGAGVSSGLFLIALHMAEAKRDQNLAILWLLPLAGFFIGWVYHHFGQDVAKGNNQVLDEIHSPQLKIPWHMTPFVFAGTVLTHLFGGSAGREGTAVQMGAALADQVNGWFRLNPQQRQVLLAAGAGAGFGAAIGTPIAGVVFGMEFLYVSRLRVFAIKECLIASVVGYVVSNIMGAPHTHYPIPSIPGYSLENFLWIAVAGMAFGLAALFFSRSTRSISWLFGKFIKYPPLKPFVSGLLLLLFYHLEGSFRFIGLGLGEIQNSLIQVSELSDPLTKSLLTSLTIGTGFKGGEFTPLVFVGSTLGSALSTYIPMGLGVLAAVGFAAVFAGASNTPLACTIMAMEIFGIGLGPYALIGCYVSFYCSGHQGIYTSQPRAQNKIRAWPLKWK